MNAREIENQAARQSRLHHLIMSRPEWANIDLHKALHELMVDVVTVSKSEGIHLYDLFHDAIGDYAGESGDQSVYDDL